MKKALKAAKSENQALKNESIKYQNKAFGLDPNIVKCPLA